MWKVAEWLEFVALHDNVGTIPVFGVDDEYQLEGILRNISSGFNRHWAHHVCMNPQGILLLHLLYVDTGIRR